MKTNADSSGTSNTFLTGAILLANLDVTGLSEYAIKAAIGGAIWLTFRLCGDWLSTKLKNKKWGGKE